MYTGVNGLIVVLSDEGSGAVSDIVAGVNFALQRFHESQQPSVAIMSLGGLAVLSQSLNMAVKNAISGGLHFAIAAGNSNSPTITSSPANVKGANTIGAVDSSNKKASFSNYGKLIDVWAPGVDILSAGIAGPDSTAVYSGTSMAA